MGITNQVRNFFTNRIREKLNEQRKEVFDEISRKIDIDQACMERLDHDHPYESILTRVERYEELYNYTESLKKDIERYRDEIVHAVRKIPGQENFSVGWRDEALKALVVQVAKSIYQKQIVAENFPEKVSRLAKIDKADAEVEAAVLLATTEPKLVAKLTELLESYGGDLGDLKSVVGL